MHEINRYLEQLDLLIKYAVSEEDLAEAQAFVRKFLDQPRILQLLEEYYSTLPEAREEAVQDLRRFDEQLGIQLIVLSTAAHSYLYALSEDDIIYLGEYGQEIAPEIIEHFDYGSQSAYRKRCRPVTELEMIGKSAGKQDNNCPACGVKEGEEHLLGCVVEVCPWCQGQLSNCPCRFEQLGVEQIDDEEQLEEFVQLLNEKGRIAYENLQGPAYPGTSDGLDKKAAK